MKFVTIFMATTLAAVSARYCDPSKWNVTFYDDRECMRVNYTMTKMYGRTEKEVYQAYSGKCEVKVPGKEWLKVQCDAKSIKTWNFMDDDCKKPTQKDSYIDIAWNNCVYYPSISPNAFRINTWQRDFYSVPASMNMSMQSPAMKFDRYFYYAIDHQGKEPGSMMPGCTSSKDCSGSRQNYEHMRDKSHGSMKQDFCCAHAEIHDMKSKKKHDIMRCMNEDVVEKNGQMMMEDIKLELKCMDGGRMSSASSLMVAAISTIALAAVNMF